MKKFFALIITMLFLLSGCGGSSTQNPAGAVTYSGEKVDVTFYVMSQCPFGTQVEDAIKPVLDKLGDAVNFKLDFIGRSEAGKLASMHGDKEVGGDKVQLCAAKYNPDKFMEMVSCMNKDAGNIPDNWQECASGLDIESIKKCYESDEGNTLLSDSFRKADSANAQGSPTIVIGGKLYEGPRDSDSFMRAICRKTAGHPACAGIPACKLNAECTEQQDKIGVCENPGVEGAKCSYKAPVKTEAVILNDKKCPNCDTTMLRQSLLQVFKGMELKEYDVSSEEGKKLIEKFNIAKVPAVIFDSKVKETEAWAKEPRLAAVFEEKNGFYKITDAAVGAKWFISEDARNEYYNKIGIDVSDGKPQIDFFVMSYCPYGNIAEEAIYQVYQLLGDKAEFRPHYVIYSNYGGECLENGKICSMHGGQELHQDIRELCVKSAYGVSKWFEFAKEMNKKCTYQNADSCWQDVAKGIGLDVDAISSCEKGKGLELVKKEKELNDILGVTGSPQIFIEGDEYAGARSPEGYKIALCSKFATAPSECHTVLAGDSTASAPAGGCGN